MVLCIIAFACRAHACFLYAVCHAFPDDAYFTDQLFVGLISAAVAWPVRGVLQRLFEKANERDDDVLDAWLVAPGGLLVKALLGAEAHRGWHFTGKHAATALVRWMARHPSNTAAGYAAEAAAQHCAACAEPPEPEPAPETTGKKHKHRRDSLSRSSALSSASADPATMRRVARRRRLLSLLGFVGVYVAWAVCCWFVFTYGIVIYRKLGSGAQQQFSSAWGLGVALDNAAEFRDILQTALKAGFVLVVLEELYLVANRQWFEGHVDHLSTQAALFAGTARGFFGQTARLLRFQRRVGG